MSGQPEYREPVSIEQAALEARAERDAFVFGPEQAEGPQPANGGECPGCGRIMSWREAWEQGGCNDCTPGGAR